MESLTVNTCELEFPPRMVTAIQFPAVLFAWKASAAEVVEPVSMLVCCTRAMVPAVTEKFTPLLDTPPAVTTTLPVVAAGGTGTAMLVSLQLVGVADVPLNLTVLVPCDAPKLAPEIVTAIPTGPEAGDKPVIVGAEETMKLIPLLFNPFTVTTTFPVVAPAGTGTTMLVALQLVGVAAVPLNVTVLLPCDAPKFVPVMVIAVPIAPTVWLRLVIMGPEVGRIGKVCPVVSPRKLS